MTYRNYECLKCSSKNIDIAVLAQIIDFLSNFIPFHVGRDINAWRVRSGSNRNQLAGSPALRCSSCGSLYIECDVCKKIYSVNRLPQHNDVFDCHCCQRKIIIW